VDEIPAIRLCCNVVRHCQYSGLGKCCGHILAGTFDRMVSARREGVEVFQSFVRLPAHHGKEVAHNVAHGEATNNAGWPRRLEGPEGLGVCAGRRTFYMAEVVATEMRLENMMGRCVLDTSVRCNVCNLFMDTDGMDEEEVRKVEYDHRADPAHVTRREKLRKRFGIVTAFNREIERVKGHRVKLALSANGRPRQ
ncbi:hypothetical protein FOZ63_017906, partial [Perkinsus olseni]